MKRAYADLDDLSSSSSKRPRKATRHTSTLAVQDPSSQTSKGSSPSTVVASPSAPSPTTSSHEDSGSNDTTSEQPGSDSSTSSQSDSGSSNTFSSESEFFQRPIGRDPNDSQSLDYDSVIESSESEIGRLEREDYELKRSLGLDPHEHREVLSVLDHRLINWDTDSTSTKSGSDSASNAESFSSTSASISDDVSQALSSSVPADNDSNPSSSSGSSSSSSNPAPASSNPNSASSSSPSPTPTTLPPSQLSTSNLSSLQSRLQTLLPQLKSANQELEVEKTAGRLGERDIEKVEEDEGERYIEMELALGVLEQRGEGGEEDNKQADDEGGEGDDVLGRLMMGKKGKRKGRGRRGGGIEEIGG